MASRVTRYTRKTDDAAARGSALPAAKREAQAASCKTLSRTALGDIGNCVAEPKTRATTKAAMQVSRGPETSTRPAATQKTDAGRKLKGAARPGSKADPMRGQLEPQSPVSVEIRGYAPLETVLCKAFSDVLLEVENTDERDDEDPKLCNDYVKDIYQYLQELEKSQPVRAEYLAGQEITGNMRAILIDWLVQVQIKFKLHAETLFMSVGIIDRFLQDNIISKRMLQLVGVTAMFIASKYEEIYPPHIGDFAYVTDNTYTTLQICQMEVKILQALNFALGRPLPLHFLRRTSRVAKVDFEHHVLAKYLMELSIIDYEMVHFPPSKIAAAAFCLAMKLLDGCAWELTVQHSISYTESDLLPVMQHLAKNIIFVNEGITKHLTIKNKYHIRKNSNISSIEQLNSCIVWDLAKPLLRKM
ncbi:G2/mitotic-specific cyclin-B1 [Phalacrocorax aristotelis]|uniref:G2/mitotic-specific cyclin-B1 n=1 Tax=Phalacrocorax aristotelis TaxID=126867 RepID=UPI003F4C106D